MPRPASETSSIGQFMIVGFDGTAMSSQLAALLKRLQPAGVVLFARNIGTTQQTHTLLKECQRLVSAPLFTCVDMEGGLVDRLKKAIAPSPSPAAVFATRDRGLFRKHGHIIGAECRAAGFNTDFAPVSDLAFEASRSVMASRAVSADPKETIVYVREFLRGLRDSGVLGCGKHFPGLGEGNLDSHHDLPVIEKSWKNLWAEDLVPYRILRRNYAFVMISHAAYPAVTGERTPASLSRKWISEVLRKKIGYRGLVVSDDLEMGGVLSAGPIEQAAVGHIRAGGDLCLICRKEEFIVKAYEEIVREAERDPKFRSRLAESRKRVLDFKKRCHELKRTSPSPTTAKMDKLTREIWEFSEQVRLATLNQEQA